MPKCSFCSKVINPGTGKLIIFKTGKLLYFCSSKCEKNKLKLNRDPRNIKWTR